jgi:acyl-CoA synthetase (AMP-forming)/AMP-acid ligase II
MLTHRNLMASLYQLAPGDLSCQDDVLVVISPFFHVVGLHGVLNLGLFTGATIATIVRYDLRTFLGAVQEHRISSAFMTPPVVSDLSRSPLVDEFDVSRLRSILCAAAPLGPEAEAVAARRLGCAVRQGFGMTEATGPISTMLIGEEHDRRGPVGTLVPSIECKIVDLGTGDEVGPGEPGEVPVRGPQVMLGYLNQPDATESTIEPDGWLHTGDVGYADAEGYLYIVDRVKEIIKYKAYQVAPYKKVRALEVVDAIPKSPSGKILRRVLVERERERAARTSG